MLTLIKNNKKFIGIIMLIFCILAFYYPTLAVVEPTNQFYVNDYANVLTTETEQYIMNMNIELNNKTKAQIVVVTVNTLEGKSIEEYATELSRKFEIGDKKENNGVLLLCSTGDRKFRIEVGYGLEGVLPDGKTGRIQDEYILPYLKNDNYDEGIKNGFSAILQEVCKEYNIEISESQNPKSTQYVSSSVMNRFITILFTSIVISIIIQISTAKNSKKNIIKLVYLIIISIISFILLKLIPFLIMILMFNIMALIGVHGGGSSGGGFHGGGFSRGRFFRTLWRRLFSAEDFLEEEVLLVVEEALEAFNNN